jgi:hypothetical protein
VTAVHITKTAQVVHQGSDGSAHFLSSNAEGSALVVSNPGQLPYTISLPGAVPVGASRAESFPQ